MRVLKIRRLLIDKSVPSPIVNCWYTDLLSVALIDSPFGLHMECGRLKRTPE